MPNTIHVGDIMTRNFTHVKPETSIIECAQTMVKKRVGSILIKENDSLTGILTEKDIIWALYKKQGKELSTVNAKDIATKKIFSIRPEATIDEAIMKMNKNKIRRLPVIENKKIIGFITQKDILKFKPSLFESLNEIETIKEEEEKLKRKDLAQAARMRELNDYDEDEDDEELE
tara:strand:- start:4817 stop:5338 length:522 start_codon:yes stop_codon:yes gene_type:complete